MTEAELKAKYGDEKVVVTPSRYVSVFLKNGFTPYKDAGDIVYITFGSLSETRFRWEMELNPAYRQHVGYAIIRDRGSGKVFTTRRLKGDSRLQNMYSIGTGGHADGNLNETLYQATRREVYEEVGLDIGLNGTTIMSDGWICSDSSEVDRVHVGLVSTVHIDADANPICVKEPDKLEGCWMTLKELADLRGYSQLESWSEIVFDNVLLEELKNAES